VDTPSDQPSDLAGIVESAFPAAQITEPEEPPRDADFVVTKEHRRFTEFADAVRKDIGNQLYQNLPNAPLRETFAA
jgi:hypothetical protein